MNDERPEFFELSDLEVAQRLCHVINTVERIATGEATPDEVERSRWIFANEQLLDFVISYFQPQKGPFSDDHRSTEDDA